MNITLRTLIAAAGVAVTFSASAQTATPNIDQRQANQQARIEQGKATGTLSKREAARMEAGQAKVQGMKQAAAADGKVTRAERKSDPERAEQAKPPHPSPETRRQQEIAISGNKRAHRGAPF